MDPETLGIAAITPLQVDGLSCGHGRVKNGLRCRRRRLAPGDDRHLFVPDDVQQGLVHGLDAVRNVGRGYPDVELPGESLRSTDTEGMDAGVMAPEVVGDLKMRSCL